MNNQTDTVFIPRFIENSIHLGASQSQHYAPEKSKIMNSINLSFQPSVHFSEPNRPILASHLQQQPITSPSRMQNSAYHTNQLLSNIQSENHSLNQNFDSVQFTASQNDLKDVPSYSIITTQPLQNSCFVNANSLNFLQSDLQNNDLIDESALKNSVNPQIDVNYNHFDHELQDMRLLSQISSDSQSEITSFQVNSIENPVIQELLPLAIQFDLVQIQETNQLPLFIQVYFKDIHRARLRSLNVFIQTLLAVEKSKLEIKFSDMQDQQIGVGLSESVQHTVNPYKYFYFNLIKLNQKIQSSRKKFIKKIYVDRLYLFARYWFTLLRKYALISKKFRQIENSHNKIKYFAVLKQNLRKSQENKECIKTRLIHSVFGIQTEEVNSSNFLVNSVFQSSSSSSRSNEFAVGLMKKMVRNGQPVVKYTEDIDQIVTHRYNQKQIQNAFKDWKFKIYTLYSKVVENRFKEKFFMNCIRNRFNFIQVQVQFSDDFYISICTRKVLSCWKKVYSEKIQRIEKFIVIGVQNMIKKQYFSQIKNLSRKIFQLQKISDLQKLQQNTKITKNYFQVIVQTCKNISMTQKGENFYGNNIQKKYYTKLLVSYPKFSLLRKVILSGLALYKHHNIQQVLQATSVFKFNQKKIQFQEWLSITKQVKQNKLIHENEVKAEIYYNQITIKKCFYFVLQNANLSATNFNIISYKAKLNIFKSYFSAIKTNFKILVTLDQKCITYLSNQNQIIKQKAFNSLLNLHQAVSYNNNGILKTSFNYLKITSKLITSKEKFDILRQLTTTRGVFNQLQSAFNSLSHSNFVHRSIAFKSMLKCNMNLLDNYKISVKFHNTYLLKTSLNILTKETLLNELYESSIIQGLQAFRMHYFKKWVVFCLKKKKIYFLEMKCVTTLQQKISNWANDINICKKQSSVIAIIGPYQAISILGKIGIQQNKTVKTALVVQDFKLMLKVLLTWRWKLRQISKWELKR